MDAAVMDYEAVEAWRAQPFDRPHKGLPADVSTVDDLVGRRVPLDGFLPPVAVLDRPALAANLDWYADYCALHGLDFAPHVKTTMAPQLAAAQARRGAWGFTVATVAQARVLRAFGARRVLIANEVVDPASVDWLAAEQEHAEVACWVDSVAGVTRLAGRSVPVYVELGRTGGRTGARGIDAAVEVARAVAATPGPRLAGVAGYEGTYGHSRSGEDLRTVRSYLRDLVKLATVVDAPIVTAGGSAYPDLVAEELVTLPVGVRKVLRSGAYVAHDHGHYAQLSPFPLEPAIRVWGVVVSTPEPGLALLNAGKRDVAHDLALPVPLTVLHDDAYHPARRLAVTELNDQHAYLADPDGEVEVGDWVALGISHPCTTFDKWAVLPLVDERGLVVDAVRTLF